jgi:hypothetical protein
LVCKAPAKREDISENFQYVTRVWTRNISPMNNLYQYKTVNFPNNHYSDNPSLFSLGTSKLRKGNRQCTTCKLKMKKKSSPLNEAFCKITKIPSRSDLWPRRWQKKFVTTRMLTQAECTSCNVFGCVQYQKDWPVTYLWNCRGKSKILESSHLVSSSKPEVGVTHKVPEEHIWPVILSKSYANSLEKGDNEYLHKAMRVPRYIVHLVLAL